MLELLGVAGEREEGEGSESAVEVNSAIDPINSLRYMVYGIWRTYDTSMVVFIFLHINLKMR